ncbi:hypothetical protein ACOMHN_029386 [Nucella lapillus]
MARNLKAVDRCAPKQGLTTRLSSLTSTLTTAALDSVMTSVLDDHVPDTRRKVSVRYTDCLVRQCCGVARPFDMDISDLQGNLLVRLHRPLRCHSSPYWCCFLQEMEIQSPPGVLVGHVKQTWAFTRPEYKVYDAQDQCIFTIIGDCCCKLGWNLCLDIEFKVFDGEGDATQVAHIRKEAGGLNEFCAGVSDFTLYFAAQMDVLKKALLFGATFLIDFNYFERNSSQ